MQFYRYNLPCHLKYKITIKLAVPLKQKACRECDTKAGEWDSGEGMEDGF